MPEYTQHECTEQIVDAAPDAAIVANLGTAAKILATVEERDLNFYMKGAMGLTTPVANGLAIQIDRDVVAIEGEQLVEYEKGTFLVYDANGEFLREESLIPPGVEL